MRIVRRRKDGLEIEIILRAWGMSSLAEQSSGNEVLAAEKNSRDNKCLRPRVPTAMLQCHGQGRGVNRQCVVVVGGLSETINYTVKAKQSYSSNPPSNAAMLNVGDTENVSIQLFCILCCLKKCKNRV